MSTHAKLSPSKRDRWSRCPGSLREESRYPEEDRAANQAAIQGTHTHTLLAHCINNNVDALEMIGIKLSDEDGEFVVDSERAERVEVALKYIDLRMRSLKNPKLYSEVKLDLSPVFGRKDMNGTSDVVIVSDEVLEIADYKDGRGSVDVIDNLQLEQYAWGVLAQMGVDTIKQHELRMTIIQPKMRSANTGNDGVTYISTTIEEFLKGKDRLAAQAAATDAPDAPLIPGEKQCQWCRHKGACVALNQQNMATLGIDLSMMNVAQDAADKDPTSMTDQQLREMIEAAPLIRKMLEAAEEEALARLKAGRDVEGLKLVYGNGRRGWAYPDEEMDAKLTKLGIPKDVRWETKLISPAKAEKVVWKKRDGTLKQLTDKQLKVLHEEYITKSDGKLTVASASDSRPAVSLSIAGMFSPVTSDKPAAPALPDFLLPLPDFLKGN
jgi:hypothetical protein